MRIIRNILLFLSKLPGQMAAGPCPLQIVAAAVAVHIQHLTAGVQAWDQTALEGVGIELVGTEPSGSDLCLIEAAGAGDGQVKMLAAVGRDRLVLDLSCRKKGGAYYIVTDRWQKFTEEEVTLELMEKLGAYCDEFLIHAVDVEGKAKGIEVSLAKLLGEYNGHPVTYAGGVGSMEDIQTLKMAAGGKVDVTVGSALDLFGGTIPFEKLIGNL